LRCDSHTVYVPSASGLHTLHVQAPRASRERIRYRLRVGGTTADDTAPGLRLANDVRVRGGLRGGELDAVDLYRFSIASRSTLRVTLATNASFDLELRRDTGGRLSCACGEPGSKELERRLAPGRYFIAVRARDGAGGRYALRRLARTITRADMRASAGSIPPGASVGLELGVTPAVDGPTAMRVERFDPLAGWLFHTVLRPPARGGRAAVSFRPPSVGRWRVTGSFEGTRRAAPSEGGTVRIRVEEPLED
ncbi:MAG TPA: PPC domain-containing protein, partial [Solirubrobacteraceae bacterium]|nr:PPC domain-containing protein [Solirubrobacteraceae bacterium]